MNLPELVPAAGDRVFFAGQTGSGKTTLARELLAYRAHVVVLDTKGTLAWPGYRLCLTLSDVLANQKEPRIIYRPAFRALNPVERRVEDDGDLNKFFKWVYARGDTTCYVDELYGATAGGRFADGFGECYTRGREKGVEMWGGTQRPTMIPQIVMSEAEHAFVFKLKLAQDRERVESLTGVDRDRIGALRKRQFFYAAQDADAPTVPMTLTLGSSPAPVVAA